MYQIETNLIPDTVVVFSTSYLNPISEIPALEQDLRQMHTGKTTILFDLLLSNGNEFNRFVQASFDGTDICDLRIVPVHTLDETVFNLFYKQHPQFLKHGVLAPMQIGRLLRTKAC